MKNELRLVFVMPPDSLPVVIGDPAPSNPPVGGDGRTEHTRGLQAALHAADANSSPFSRLREGVGEETCFLVLGESRPPPLVKTEDDCDGDA